MWEGQIVSEEHLCKNKGRSIIETTERLSDCHKYNIKAIKIIYIKL